MLSIAVLSQKISWNTICASLKCKRVKLRLIHSRLTLARNVNKLLDCLSLLWLKELVYKETWGLRQKLTVIKRERDADATELL